MIVLMQSVLLSTMNSGVACACFCYVLYVLWACDGRDGLAICVVPSPPISLSVQQERTRLCGTSVRATPQHNTVVTLTVCCCHNIFGSRVWRRREGVDWSSAHNTIMHTILLPLT